MTAGSLLVDPTSSPASPVLLRAMLLGHPDTVGIELLLWPADEDRRRELEVLDRPCLLILGEDEPAPVCGPLEDWVRAPTPLPDIAARCAGLRGRAACAARPFVHDGALHFSGERVELSSGQRPLAQLLTDRYREVVRRDELAEVGGQSTEEALKAALARLATRIAPTGLSIRTIRGTGHLLEPTTGCGSQHPHVANASESRV